MSSVVMAFSADGAVRSAAMSDGIAIFVSTGPSVPLVVTLVAPLASCGLAPAMVVGAPSMREPGRERDGRVASEEWAEDGRRSG